VPIDSELVPSPEKEERNWLPLIVAVGVVLLIAAVTILSLQHRGARAKSAATVTPISAPLDPYAGNLQVTGLAMSEASNLSGGKTTYLDGHIANRGSQTVTAITVQVLFRDFAHEVAQNETQPLKLIRTREPYIDVESISAAPLKAGSEQDFRLIFDRVSPDWDGAYPEIRILHVETK
jgi:Tfp pilus assembly major pilin PilA